MGSAVQEEENSLKQLLDLINTRENAFSAVGAHSQAVAILVSLLRLGSLGVKIHAATVLGSLYKEEELRVKVLLGGCIPPLLGLLKSGSTEAQLAAAKAIHAGPKVLQRIMLVQKISQLKVLFPWSGSSSSQALRLGNL